ncbi:hypothetical protein [Paenibacillus sp. FSL H8-0168]|uniref:hypothetical protein n=1 Tax=Paenibacillus sp. FSL H8-0168 TaxID=2921378 RepID=UPI00315847F0
MGKRSKSGICHICGQEGPLTFEHIPPKGAFNDRPIIKPNFEQFANKGPEEKINGKIHQKGAGSFSLCAKCNNDTGAYYGNDFIDWAYQAMVLNQMSLGSGEIYYPFNIFPLRVIKQILTMFFSTNGEAFHKNNRDLARFVLNPESVYMKPDIRIFVYLMTGEYMRYTGLASMGSFDTGKITTLSEISFPPMGYIMTINSDPPDERLFEITHFARYGYNQFDTVHLKLHNLPVNYYLPADFRTVDEIMDDYKRNTEDNPDLT